VSVQLDVGERALAVSVRGTCKAAGGLPAAAWRPGELAERVGRRYRTGKATHSLLADVVVAGVYGTGHM
jgi:hypothetical protein